MKILLNGKDIDFSGKNITDIINNYKLKKNEIVVEKNGMIIHREEYDKALLEDGDTLEIVSFVGGG